MRLKLLLSVVSVIVFSLNAGAQCVPSDDGDCCEQDSDCGVYANEALCAVVPLNTTTIRRLSGQSQKRLASCKDDALKKIREEAANSDARCENGICVTDQPAAN